MPANRTSFQTSRDKSASFAAFSSPSGSSTQLSRTDMNNLYTLSLSNLTKSVEASDFNVKPSPFYIRWVHGFNHRAGVINLNDKGTTTVFYAACNFGVLYNWTTNNMRILQGHRHMVTCIAADEAGTWLVTGDTGSENSVIVWDTRDIFPRRTIFNPHKNIKMAKLALSKDAKYLLTLGYGDKAQLHWWIWSIDESNPHAEGYISVSKESILAMEFNPKNSLQFAMITKDELWLGMAEKVIVSERGVVKETEEYQLKLRMPEKKPTPEFGRQLCFCFVANTSQIIVATSRGAVHIFGYTLEYSTDADSSDIENMKYVKSLKIENRRINVMKLVEGIIVTGNSGGEIHFYDDQMKLLYWVHGFKVDSVRGLSFNISPRSYMILDPKCNTQCPCWESVIAETDPTTGVVCTKLVKKKLPTDATKGGLPFIVRDFVIWTLHQGIGFVDFVTEKLTTILDYRISPALSLSAHPEQHLICIGYLDGNIELVNYTQHKLRARLDLRDYYKIVVPPKNDSIKCTTDITLPRLSVSCLKYSPSGLHLACGLNTGQLIFLDPTTIDIRTKKPFKDTRFSIQDIDFSPDSLTMAFADVGKTVCVYKYDCEDLKWNFIGKHRAHYKDITSLFFLPAKNADGNYKLLSFGMDRIMAEYDIGKSSDECLEVLSLDRMDQTAVPLAGIVWPTPKGLDQKKCHSHMPNVLIANDEYKYKIINYETSMTLATYVGPRFEHPVRHVQLFRDRKKTDDNLYLLFATKIIIGLQKMPLDGNPWKQVGMLGHPVQSTRQDHKERRHRLRPVLLPHRERSTRLAVPGDQGPILLHPDPLSRHLYAGHEACQGLHSNRIVARPDEGSRVLSVRV